MSRSFLNLTRVLPLLGCLLLGAICTPAQDSAGEARAASVTGHVLIASGGAASMALVSGTGLSPGDRIDTRGGGRLVISLSDGSMVIVQPESVVTIKDFRSAESLRELFEITLGRVRVKINHFAGRPNPYRMNSPTASIAVRGTEFSVAVDAYGNTQVEVFEGSVEVSSRSEPDRKTVLGPGNGVLVRPGQDFRYFTPQFGRDLGDANGGPGDDRDRRQMGARPDGGRPDIGRPDLGRPDLGRPDGGRQEVAGARPDVPHGDPASARAFGDHDPDSPRNAAGTYSRYIASLSEVGQMPFLMRFNAFPDAHLDSLENPAYASEFHTAEGRLFLLPTLSGRGGLDDLQAPVPGSAGQPVEYSFSPQISMFTPIEGTRFTIGGSFAASASTSGSVLPVPAFDPILPGQPGTGSALESGSSTSRFLDGSFVVARPLGASGRTSFGFGLDRLSGSGSLLNQSPSDQTDMRSRINQTRLTLGWSHEFAGEHKLGVFSRYGFISASDSDLLHIFNGQPAGLDSTISSGHSAEIGLRLRGPVSRRLFYGIQATWLGLSLDDRLQRAMTVDSGQRDRVTRGALGFGVGYMLRRQTVLSVDVAGGYSHTRALRSESANGDLLETARFGDRFFSVHAAMQSDVWRNLFVSASLLLITQGSDVAAALFADRNGLLLPPSALLPFGSSYSSPTRFSDFGAGWRFSPRLTAQYVLSTDYGISGVTHTLMLRYTFRLRE